jgi:hypothetical protein
MIKKLLIVAFATISYANSYSYAQYNYKNELEYRVINSKTEPKLYCDGKKIVMQTRYEGNYSVWFANINSCKKVSFNNKSLKIDKKQTTIAVVGDSGCRIKLNADQKGTIQNCDDNNSWPAQKIADAIALHNPNLIIHVGDYHYRERCKDGDICTSFDVNSSDVGYGYDIWEKDFFKPYEKLFSKAPFIFGRGNHESCNRAWQVYKATLSPYEYSECNAQDDGKSFATNSTELPYIIKINGSDMVIFDSSADDDDERFFEPDYQFYLKYFSNYKKSKASIVTHVPIYNLNYDNAQTSRRKALQDSGFVPSFVLSGDLHILEFIQTKNTAQIISGGGGSALYALKEIENNFEIKKQINNFGFAILTKTKKGYNGAFYSFENEKLYEFKIK